MKSSIFRLLARLNVPLLFSTILFLLILTIFTVHWRESYLQQIAVEQTRLQYQTIRNKVVDYLQHHPDYLPRLLDKGAKMLQESSELEIYLLGGREYLYHPDEKRIGDQLNRDSEGDKAMYDLQKDLRVSLSKDRIAEDGQVVEKLRTADMLGASLAGPIVLDGRYTATLRVVQRFDYLNCFKQRLFWMLIGLAWANGLFLGVIGAWFSRSEAGFDWSGLLLLIFTCLVCSTMILLSAGTGVNAPKSDEQGHPQVSVLFSHLIKTNTTQVEESQTIWQNLQPYHFSYWPYPFIGGLLLSILCFCFFRSRWFKGQWRRMREVWFAYTYVAPAMLGMLALVFFPFFYGIGLSFFRIRHGEVVFVWLEHFITILSDFNFSDHQNFYFTFVVTIMWTVINVVLHVSIGLALALILNNPKLKYRGIYRVLLIVPWAVPNYITALIWKSMFHRQFGAVNAFLGLLGIEPISWFNTFWPAFTANVVTNTWLGFPFMMVISLGALQSIPQELYEAAKVDGAGKWSQFRHITLPLLRPALFPAIILGTIWTFNMFNIIYLVSGGAPSNATDILIVEAYRFAFEQYKYGYAAAYSTIIFFILFFYTITTNRYTKATEGAFD